MLNAIFRDAVLRRPRRVVFRADNSWAGSTRLYPLAQSSRWLQASSGDIVPLRKQLKDEAKANKSQRNKVKLPDAGDLVGTPISRKWELTVGLEIHAQLNTERKLFSGNTYKA